LSSSLLIKLCAETIIRVNWLVINFRIAWIFREERQES
jgi:hypothetical protein